ncbi:MAG TPA: MFS transporter [Ferruginibacter sp.]|jgi:MFS family permease|nr:MFS transporter [Ferruginibacter sp.]
MKIITRTIWILSLVSLFADVASEMLYPIMPVYLKSIGFSILLIGVLEGIAEGVAGLSKGYFGKLSDAKGVRLPFIKFGYLFSSISKPLMAVLTFPLWIFGIRTIDRVGKGLRTGARDAMLSDESTPQTKATVFGFHRGMDTLGAVIGPVIALVYLYFAPNKYKPLFYIAFIPSVISVLLVYLLREKEKVKKEKKTVSYNFFSFINYWKTATPIYRKLVTALLLFALFNSSDYFLLLRMKEAGLSDMSLIGTYIFYNIIYAAFSYPLGILADRIGLKNIFIVGLMLFAIVYAGMAINNNIYVFFLLFFLYGIYAAATDGISKAWITNIASKDDTATAIGTFTAFQSVSTMIASALAGWIWLKFGSTAIFYISSIVTIIVCFYLLLAIKNKNAYIERNSY